MDVAIAAVDCAVRQSRLRRAVKLLSARSVMHDDEHGLTLLDRQQLAEIMVEYGAVNAGNLDGGASSDMYFNGEYVNVCNTSGGPRGIPTAVVVMPAQ